MKKFFGIAALVCLLASGAARAETFDNDSVIALAGAEVGDDVLLAKINSLPCSYDVSTDAIIRLKKAGVSNVAISAMVDRCIGSTRAQGGDDTSSDPLVKRTPGIYLQRDSGLAVIRPTTVSSLRVTGNGSILFPYMARMVLPQAAAQVTVPGGNPAFYFYFEAGDARVGDFGTSASAAAQSPSEFSLVRFRLKDGRREVTVGKASAVGGLAGIDPKNTLPFSIAELADGIFKAEMAAPLVAGQYAFILRAGDTAYRIYDFQVK